MPERYTGTVATSIAHGAKTVYVYCLGPDGQPPCGNMPKVNLSDIPQLTWQDVADRFRCNKCGARGRVQIRFNHQESGTGGRACNIIDGKIIPQ